RALTGFQEAAAPGFEGGLRLGEGQQPQARAVDRTEVVAQKAILNPAWVRAGCHIQMPRDARLERAGDEVQRARLVGARDNSVVVGARSELVLRHAQNSR